MPVFLRFLGAALLAVAAGRRLRGRVSRGGGLPPLSDLRVFRRGRRPVLRSGLPFALEVWAAVLTAGQPMVDAIGQAQSCCGEPVAAPLLEVYDGLMRGLSSAQAWAGALAELDSPVLVLAGQACVRSERDGTPLAPVLRRLAAEERATAASRGLIAARRAGVLAVLPLGLCTLPAYLLLAVAPAVIGLIRHTR